MENKTQQNNKKNVFGQAFSKKASGRGFKSHPPHHEQTYPTLAFPEQFNII